MHANNYLFLKVFIMKNNRGLIILVAAGVIVAGVAAAVLLTEKGQQYSRDVRKQSSKLIGKAEVLASGLKQGINKRQEAHTEG